MGPGRTRANDYLCAIDGGFCPYIVRPEPTSEIDTHADGGVVTPRYELVGDCYVAEFMDAAAWGNDSTTILLI